MVTFPESYGVNRIQPRAEDEIHRLLAQGHNLTEFFSGHHWSIHPDWLYCKSKYKTYESPEKELKDILKAVSQPWWKWPLNRSPPSPEHTANFYCKCMDISACWRSFLCLLVIETGCYTISLLWLSFSLLLDVWAVFVIEDKTLEGESIVWLFYWSVLRYDARIKFWFECNKIPQLIQVRARNDQRKPKRNCFIVSKREWGLI